MEKQLWEWEKKKKTTQCELKKKNRKVLEKCWNLIEVGKAYNIVQSAYVMLGSILWMRI